MSIGEILRNLKAIMLAIAILPVWAHAQTLGMGAEGGLFIPLSAADAAQLPSASVSQEPFSDAQSGAEPEAPANGWLVRIDRQRLFRTIHGVAEQGSGRLLLNLANGLEFDVVVERTRRTLSGHSLSGRVEGVAGSAVTMVAHAEAVAGTVWTPGAAWELVPLQDGIHAFRKLDFSARPLRCKPIRAQDGRGEFRSIEPADAEAEGAVVDVLALWTPLTQSRAGGEAQMRAHIDHAVAWTNDAYERSGAEVRLNLVGAELIDYDEDGDFGQDLTRLRNPSDGFMDEAHVRRDALGADLVSLTVRFGDVGVGGIAFLPGYFSVVALRGDSYPASAFAHELGHNFGLNHDRYEVMISRGGAANGFNYGYVNKLAFEPGAAHDACWRTIMAYPDRCQDHLNTSGSKVPFFSTPNQRYLGAPLGVSESDNEAGVDGPSDAVLSLNQTYRMVADARSARADDGDTADAATPVAADSTTFAQLTDRDDIDYFRIELPEAGVLGVKITGSGTSDLRATLTDEDGGFIAENDSSNDFQIEADLEAGVYFISVRWTTPNSSKSVIGYALVVSFNPASAADAHGDLAAKATAVAIPSSTAGELQHSADIDYFRFEISERSLVRMETTGDTDVFGRLADEDDRSIASDDDRGPATNFQIDLWLEPGVYFVAVTGFEGATGRYEINFSLTSMSDALDGATPIAIGSTANGELETPLGWNFFRIEIPAPGQLWAESYEAVKMTLLPLDSDEVINGKFISENGQRQSTIAAHVASGSYILGVKGHEFDASSYQVSVSLIADSRSIPLFISASDPMRQSFARIINRSLRSGTAAIHAIDEAGQRFGPITLSLAAGQAVHFNSDDLERGNAGKGLPDGLGAGEGDWQLRLATDLDIEALAYVRTNDGFLTAMHEAATSKIPAGRLTRYEPLVPIFNPASNRNQASKLRLINSMPRTNHVRISGYDDRGNADFERDFGMEVPGLASRVVTAQELEREIGDGIGKWRLGVSTDGPIGVMSLLESPTGHLTNLTSPASPAVPAGGQLSLPLFISASNPTQQGFVRVIHRGSASATVTIHAIDDAGRRRGPVRLSLGPGDSVHFNSDDLETGNAAKGLSGGLGAGEGDWRLELAVDSAGPASEIQALAHVRTNDGFLTGMNALAPQSNGRHEVVIFNPGSNSRQVSKLRLINPADAPATITISGLDDAGAAPPEGEVTLSLEAGAATAITAQQLEAGAGHFEGRFGDGAGKWRLFIEADQDIQAMSLLESPTGHISNLSSGTAVREPSTGFASLLELGAATNHRHSGNLPSSHLARAQQRSRHTLAWLSCCALSTAPSRGAADVRR